MFKKTFLILLTVLSIFGQSQILGSRLDKKTLALGEVGVFKINISGEFP